MALANIGLASTSLDKGALARVPGGAGSDDLSSLPADLRARHTTVMAKMNRAETRSELLEAHAAGTALSDDLNRQAIFKLLLAPARRKSVHS